MYLLGLKYLEALPQVTAGAGTTIFLPAKPLASWAPLAGFARCSRAARADRESPPRPHAPAAISHLVHRLSDRSTIPRAMAAPTGDFAGDHA